MDGESYDIPIGRCFKTFDEFEMCLKKRSQIIGEKWRKASGNSTVERENLKIKTKSKHYPLDLKYAYINYRCIHEGQFVSRGCQQRERCSSKLGCPAKFKLVAQRKKGTLVVTKSLLQHNHPLLPPADGIEELGDLLPPPEVAPVSHILPPPQPVSAEASPQNSNNNWVISNTYQPQTTSTVMGNHSCLNGGLDDFPSLKAVVPEKYIYHVCNYVPEVNGFHCRLRFPFKYKEQCLQWKKELEMRTCCTLLEMKSAQEHNVFTSVYHCHLSNHGKPREQFGCQSYVSIEIKRTSEQNSLDDHLPGLACVIDMQWNHNHELKPPQVLKTRDVSKATRSELVSLFRLGYSAEGALGILRTKIQSKLGVEYHEVVFGDRSIIPDISYVARLRSQEIHKTNDTYLDELSNDLDGHIESHIRRHPGTVSMKKTDGGHIVIAIANEFMKNISYQLKESGDIMYMKSRDNCNRRGCHVYLLLTICHAGGLPLGCLITTSDETSTIVQGLQLYMSLLTDQAFFSQGYPNIIMAPDSSSEGEALRLLFPHSTHLISTYHILNTSWRQLSDKNNKLGIHKKQTIYVYSLLRNMIVSKTVEELECYHRTLLSKFPNITTYSVYLYAMKELWGLWFRKHFPVYNGDIDKYIQAELSIFKENIFSGTNGFSLVQLFDVVTRKIMEHYIGKITGSLTSVVANVSTVDYPSSAVNKVTDDIFIVNCHVGQKYFYVNTDIATCTCYAGMKGEHCEHIRVVELYYPDCALKASSSTADSLLYLIPTTHLDIDDDTTDEFASTNLNTGQSDENASSSSSLDTMMQCDDKCTSIVNSNTNTLPDHSHTVLKMDISVSEAFEQSSLPHISLQLIEPESQQSHSGVSTNKGSNSNPYNLRQTSGLGGRSSNPESSEPRFQVTSLVKEEVDNAVQNEEKETTISETEKSDMEAVYGSLDYIRGKLKRKVKTRIRYEERIKKLKGTWQQFEQLVRDKPDVFGPAVDAFLSNLNKLKAKDDIHLTAALFKFGNTVK